MAYALAHRAFAPQKVFALIVQKVEAKLQSSSARMFYDPPRAGIARSTNTANTIDLFSILYSHFHMLYTDISESYDYDSDRNLRELLMRFIATEMAKVPPLERKVWLKEVDGFSEETEPDFGKKVRKMMPLTVDQYWESDIEVYEDSDFDDY